VGLAVRKSKGAHRRTGAGPASLSARRAAVHGEHYTHAKKAIAPTLHRIWFFFLVLKLMYTRSQPLTYTKCGCALKKRHTQNTLLPSSSSFEICRYYQHANFLLEKNERALLTKLQFFLFAWYDFVILMKSLQIWIRGN
jgi:hypothetical protein